MRVPDAPNPCQQYGVVSVLDLTYSNKCVVLSYCFKFQFLNDISRWEYFHVLACHLYMWCLFRSFAHFSIGSFAISLQNVEFFMYFRYKSFIRYVRVNIFSHSLTCVFMPLKSLSFQRRKLRFRKLCDLLQISWLVSGRARARAPDAWFLCATWPPLEKNL